MVEMCESISRLLSRNRTFFILNLILLQALAWTGAAWSQHARDLTGLSEGIVAITGTEGRVAFADKSGLLTVVDSLGNNVGSIDCGIAEGDVLQLYPRDSVVVVIKNYLQAKSSLLGWIEFTWYKLLGRKSKIEVWNYGTKRILFETSFSGYSSECSISLENSLLSFAHFDEDLSYISVVSMSSHEIWQKPLDPNVLKLIIDDGKALYVLHGDSVSAFDLHAFPNVSPEFVFPCRIRNKKAFVYQTTAARGMLTSITDSCSIHEGPLRFYSDPKLFRLLDSLSIVNKDLFLSSIEPNSRTLLFALPRFGVIFISMDSASTISVPCTEISAGTDSTTDYVAWAMPLSSGSAMILVGRGEEFVKLVRYAL